MSVFKYGTYSHTDGTVDLVNFDVTTLLDERGNPERLRKTMTIEGVLIGDGTQSNLKTLIDALEDAYSENGKDAILLHDDSTESSHKLDSSAAIGGVKVLSLSYPRGGAGEYATQRTFQVVLQAEFEASQQENIVRFQDSITLIGNGGPRLAILETISGAPVPQVLAQRTMSRAQQSGEAVGYRSYPNPAIPFAPGNEQGELRAITRIGPERDFDDTFRNFTTRWSYSFIATTPLIGLPVAG